MVYVTIKKGWSIVNKTKFFDDYFKILVLLFWPIIWFKWQFLATDTISFTLFIIYLALATVYFITFTYSYLVKKNCEKIVYFYRISTLLAFISTLLSFLLYPTNMFLLLIKMIFAAIYFYVSCLMVYKYNIDEGVVGILSVFLLVAIVIFIS